MYIVRTHHVNIGNCSSYMYVPRLYIEIQKVTGQALNTVSLTETKLVFLACTLLLIPPQLFNHLISNVDVTLRTAQKR